MVNKHFSPTLEHWYAFKHDGLTSNNPPTLTYIVKFQHVYLLERELLSWLLIAF